MEGGDYQEEKEVDFEELENALLDEFGDELELEEDPQDGNGLMPTSGEEGAVRRAAWSLFEVLLPRCVGLEGQSLETRLEEPTGFSHRYELGVSSCIRPNAVHLRFIEREWSTTASWLRPRHGSYPACSFLSLSREHELTIDPGSRCNDLVSRPDD